MAGIKLYPPNIVETLPAFYQNNLEEENGTVKTKITVPFSMNRAVNSSEIWGFSIKIKTVQTNEILSNDVSKVQISDEILANNQVDFIVDSILENIVVGQFLKVQLAYVSKDEENDGEGIVGYYSTVGIIKYTDEPTLSIKEYEKGNNIINLFHPSCIGVYECGEDKTEKPYSYKFSLYQGETRIDSSGWLLHNSSLSLDEITNAYTFNTSIELGVEYEIEYRVKTINNLEVYQRYTCIDVNSMDFPLFPFDLKAENNFDDGYIQLSFESNVETELLFELSWQTVNLEIYKNNELFQTISFTDYKDIENWNNSLQSKDFLVEQGKNYEYSFRQFNKFYHSPKYLAEPENITADFEDMFLYDGEKQLKIRFNPKVSSFKINKLEQKIDTIGSKYPYIFRNGVVEYREFPISGLISYHMDDKKLFINYSNDLSILSATASERMGTPETRENNPWENTENLNLISKNIYSERKFKMALLDWLGDGKIKLFKSPVEGNYLVRLMNISLSPEDKLNRMINTFSCTAYEIEELNNKNLFKLGLLKNNDLTVEDSNNIKNIYYIEQSEQNFTGEQIINVETASHGNYKLIKIKSISYQRDENINDFDNYIIKLITDNNIEIIFTENTFDKIDTNLLYKEFTVGKGYIITLKYSFEILVQGE